MQLWPDVQSVCAVHFALASESERQTPSLAQVPMRESIDLHMSLVVQV
jgi:hypothetical protein